MRRVRVGGADDRMTGAELRALRRAQGLRRRDLARQLLVPPNLVARWERDEVRIPPAMVPLNRLFVSMPQRASPQRIFNRLNATFFEGRLPRFTVRQDITGDGARCILPSKRIRLGVDLPPEELEQAIVHEIVHIVTGEGHDGGDHDDAFRRELRRVAELGCRVAQDELTLEEWHADCAQAAKAMARAHPEMHLWDVVTAVTAQIGPSPDNKQPFSQRVLLAFQVARRESSGRSALPDAP